MLTTTTPITEPTSGASPGAARYARSLIEASLDPLVTISPEGKITDVNRATESITGLTRSALIGTDFSDYFTEPEVARAGYQKVFADGQVTDYPLAVRHVSGRVTDVLYNASVYRDDTGAVVGVFAAARDITERKRAEDARRAAAQYARSLIEASLDPLVTISLEGKITDVNLATEKITGLSRVALIGTDFSDYFTEPEVARAGYQKVFAEGQVTDYPLVIRHASGTVTDVLYNASVYRNERGDVQGVFAAARDITERKRAESSRLTVERKLQDAKRAQSLGRMAAAIAHHFNNQLTGVRMNLEFALGEAPRDSEFARSAANAIQLVDRAAEVSILMLTYLGHSSEPRVSVDLAALCRRVVPALQGVLPKGVTLRVDLPESGPVLQATPSQLDLLIRNLVTNAWESLDAAAGTVQLAVRTMALADIPAAARHPVDWQPHELAYAAIEVADTGCGIASEDMEKLFDPFFSTKFTGRGLGLSVALGVARAHGGGIVVKSHPGQGTMMRAFLSMQPPPPLP